MYILIQNNSHDDEVGEESKQISNLHTNEFKNITTYL